MLNDKIASLYAKVEDKWYSLLDFLQSKGVPAYSYADFLENRGIPSLPFTIALFILLAVLFSVMLSPTTLETTVTLKLKDNYGKTLTGVRIEFLNEMEQPIKTIASAYDGQNVTLKDVPFGAKLIVRASKKGYDNATEELAISSRSLAVELTLAKQFANIVGKIRVVDADTATIVQNADCNISFEGTTIKGINSAKGIVEFYGVPPEQEVELYCSANGYEQLYDIVSFREGEVITMQLHPSVQGLLLGKTSLLISVRDLETKELLQGVRIKIINAGTDAIISDVVSETGEHLEKINYGTKIKITIEKEGYLTYASAEMTLREEEKTLTIYLEKGGTRILARVFSKEMTPQANAYVALFDERLALIDSKTTDFSATVVFEGLSPNKKYYITAHKQGFLPLFQEVTTEQSEINLILERATKENSALITVRVLDAYGKEANNATVRFYRLVNGKRFPLGIPSRKTNLGGIVAETLPAGTISIEVETATEHAEKTIEVKAGQNEEVIIELERKATIVELTLVDQDGNPITGHVTIKTKSGELLFDADVEDGLVVFDSLGNESVFLTVETSDGKTFEQEVRIDGKDSAEVRIITREEALYPQIEFIGVFDAKGEQIQGVTKGEYAWLKFNVSFPQAEQAGVHIRVGPDSVPFADSQEIGIYGFDGTASRFIYGKSYQPPLGQSADMANKGRPNSRNKWLELYYDKPPSQATISIKVKTENLHNKSEFEVHYRAWAKLGDKFFRDPKDDELGSESSTSKKQALYAETKTVTVKIFESRAKCEQGICLDFSFIDELGVKYKAEEFSAIVDGIYALELSISSMQNMQANVTISTNQERYSIAFSEITQDTARFLPLQEFDKLELSSIVDVQSNFEEVLRAYFKAIDVGPATINVVVNSGELQIEKTLYFNVNEKKEIKIELENSGNINAGENIRVTLKDKASDEAITDALIEIVKDGQTILSVQGNNTIDNGANGVYIIPTEGLSPGKYELVVQSEGFKEERRPVIIGVDEILSMDPSLDITLEKGERERVIVKTIENRSIDTIKNLSYELKPIGTWPEDFEVEVLLPAEIKPQSSAAVTITVRYTGDEEKRISAEAELIITGTLDAVVTTTTRIRVAYNLEVPTECIEFDKEEVDVHLVGMANSTETVQLIVKYKEEERCNKPLAFTISYETEDPNIEIIGKEFTIAPAEEKEIGIKVFNKIERAGVFEEEVLANVFFEAAEMEKSVKFNIYFTDPTFALQTNDNIPLFMSADIGLGVIEGVAPLFVKNFGKKRIENLHWSVRAPPQIDMYVLPTGEFSYEDISARYHTAPGEVSIELQSPGMPYLYGQPTYERARFAPEALEPGEEILPPKTIYAVTTALNLDRGPHKAEIYITGTVDGIEFSKTVTVWLIVSTAECLRIAAVDELYFQSEESEQGVMSRNITIRNDCGEVIRELNIEPSNLGQNALSLYILGDKTFLLPGETVQAQIMLTKREDYFNAERPDMISVKGFLINSQKFTESNALPIIVEIGRKAEVGAGPAYQEINMQICEEAEGITKSVRFPILSADKDCSSGYCDAVQLSGYIAKKMEDTLASVDRLLQSNGEDISNYPMCAENASFCSFAAMGITPEVFVAYMRNDNLTKEILEKRVNEEVEELSTFVVDYSAGDIQDILSTATGFTTSHIFLSKPLTGCGRYKLSIQGALQNVQGKLARDQFFLFIKVVEDRQVTPECTLKVQNAINFLPVDSGLKAGSSYNTWFGAVEADESLKEVGDAFATALFGTKEGRVNVPLQTNKLKVLLAEIKEGGVLKLEIPQSSSAQARPIVVLAQINDVYGSVNEELQNEIVTKAKESLASLMEGSFELDACIGKDEGYMVIERFEKLGELSIEGDSELELYYDMPSCADLNVVSNMGEKVALKTNWGLLTTNEKTGLKEVWLEVDGQRIDEYSTEQGIAGTPVQLEPVEDKPGLYKKSFKLCVVGDNGYVELAADKKIKVKAKSVTFPTKEMRNWHEVTVKLCGIHPYSLLKKMSEVDVEPGEEKIFYATLGWKGDPEAIDFRGISRGLLAEQRGKKAQELIEEVGKGGRIDDTPVGRKILHAKRVGYLWYWLTCTSVSAMCNGVKRGALTAIFGSVFAIWNLFQAAFFDCGFPAFAGYLSTTEGGRGFIASMGNAWQSVKNFFHGLWSKPKETFEPVIPTDTGEVEKALEQYREEAIPAAILGAEVEAAGTVVRHILDTFRGTTPIGALNIEKVADEAASVMARNFSQKMLGNQLQEEIKKPLKEQFLSILKSAKKNTRLNTVFTEDTVKSVWANSTPKIRETLISHMDELSDTEFASKLRQLGQQKLGEVFNADEIVQKVHGKNLLGGSAKSIDPNDFVNEVYNITEQAKERILKEIDLGSIRPHLGNTADTIEDVIETEIRNQLLGIRDMPGRIDPKTGRIILRASDIDSAVKQSIESVSQRYGTQLVEAYGKEGGEKVIRELGEEIGEKVPAKGRLRRLLNWRVIGRVVRGAACDALGNLAGFYVWNTHVRNVVNALQKKGALPEPEVEFANYDKMLANYEGEPQLFKNRTYKITIGKDNYGNPYYRVELVDTPEEFEEMHRAISENPGRYWVDDCREYRNKGLQESLGCLVPEASDEVKAEHVVAYYTNNSKFREASLTYNVQEALIMAALITQPENFSACDIAEEWYSKPKEQIDSTIDCVARRLSEALEASKVGENQYNITSALRMLSADPNKGMQYARNVESTYNLWNKFDICVSQAS